MEHSGRDPVLWMTGEDLFRVVWALFCVTFLISAVLLQIAEHEPPTKSGTVVDQFNSTLLWVASVLALVIATERPRPVWKVAFWLGATATFAALAIDEVYEFHEETRLSLGEDDYAKMLFWLAGVFGAFLICRVARPTREVVGALVLAVACQSLWLLADMGDGDFFTLPIPRPNLLWSEELLEILASQCALSALLLHCRNTLRSGSKI